MGPARFQYVDELIQVNGTRLLAIAPPKDGAAFPTLNGVFYDNEGRESFRISDNIWEGPTEAWDLAIVGKTLQVRTSADRVALQITLSPPDRIYVDRLDMFIDGCHILCDEQMIRVGQVRDGRWTYIGFGRFECLGAATGIRVLDTVDPHVFEGVRIIGGMGVELRGTGITLGVEAAQMTMHSLFVWEF